MRHIKLTWTIDMDTFKGLTKLCILDLSENSIKTTEMDIFKGLTELHTLDLSGNIVST